MLPTISLERLISPAAVNLDGWWE